jgi:hypothetical protein
VRAPLALEQHGQEGISPVGGRAAAVRVENGKLSFALPDSNGSVRGSIAQNGALQRDGRKKCVADVNASLNTFLRNPERNAGLFFNPDRLERQGDELLLEKSGSTMTADRVVSQDIFHSLVI